MIRGISSMATRQLLGQLAAMYRERSDAAVQIESVGGVDAAKRVQATPGVPVGSMVAEGKVALGFQQLSELLHVPGIDVVGAMPEPVQIITTFSGAICATCTQPDEARDLLVFMGSPATADAKRR